MKLVAGKIRRSADLRSAVLRICNPQRLRRAVTRGNSKTLPNATPLRACSRFIGVRRYSRLQICATPGRFSHCLAFACLLFPLICFGQTLTLPPRHPKALTGTQFTKITASLPAPSSTSNERENWIFHEIISGNVPDFLRTLKPITVSASGHTATYYVTPDYLAIGSDVDYFLTPMTPLLAQRLCDYLGHTLPTRKMVNQIWTNAAVKMDPQTIPPSAEMITVPVFAWHNYMVRTQRNDFTNSFPLGALVSGNKKDVIVSARIYTNFATAVTEPVVIYGWHYPDGSFIQPLYNGHEETYSDYSHCLRPFHPPPR